MKQFVWYSNNTKESGQALAEKLGCEHGTVAPKGFDGELICFGAAPSEKFKWNDRKPTRVINDPRKFRKYVNKDTLRQDLGGAMGVPRRLLVVKGQDDQYQIKSSQAVPGSLNLPVPNGVLETPRVLQDITSALTSVGSPEFAAVDVLIGSRKNGAVTQNVVLITNVVFGPSVVDNDAALNGLVDSYMADPDSRLSSLVGGMSSNEKQALLKLLDNLKKVDDLDLE